MWKKVQMARSKIGPPTPIDTSVDQNVLQSISDNSPRNQNAGRKDVSKDLPALPTEAIEPTAPSPEPQPRYRVASSIYSRDSRALDPHFPRQISPNAYYSERAALDDHVDISPPDSPIGLRAPDQDSPDISPIDETPKHMFHPTQRKSRLESQIPILRKDNRFSYSQRAAGQSSSKGPGLLGAGKEKFQAGKKLLKGRDQTNKDNKDENLAPREPWKGASGRSALINPVESKQDASTFVPPERESITRSPSPFEHLDFTRQHGYTVTTIRTGNAAEREAEKKRFANKKNAKPSQPAAKLSSSQSGTTVRQVDPVEAHLTSKLPGLHVSEEPGSRFSATTYAPTEAGHSPAGSIRAETDADAPPVPTISASIMERKRPTTSTPTSAKSTIRKPTPSINSPADVETSKSLPQGPPAVQVQSRINSLEARQKELAVRKANINTIIYELTQVIQPSSVAYDMATRDEVKRTVISLNNELDDIKREEHDIGVKLIRAWKKRDELDEYEPTGLWVKRVTS